MRVMKAPNGISRTKSIIVFYTIVILILLTTTFLSGCQSKTTMNLAPNGTSPKPPIIATPVPPPFSPTSTAKLNTIPIETLSLSSPAFQNGEKVPAKYTCDGQNISPLLRWSLPPQESRSFVLIVDDPDAPSKPFTHWVLFNLPAASRELAEAIPTQDQLPDGALQGKNDFGKIGYSGPCPPSGFSHRYRFTIYALNQPLDLKAGASKQQVLDAIQGHILAQALLIGTYQH